MMGKTLYGIPFIFQYNKQDLSEALDSDVLQDRLNEDRVFSCQPTCAVTGEGVGSLVRKTTDLVLAAVL
jgi:Fe2+ transport system protein B